MSGLWQTLIGDADKPESDVTAVGFIKNFQIGDRFLRSLAPHRDEHNTSPIIFQLVRITRGIGDKEFGRPAPT